jgi:hypothetical protein
MRKPAGSVSPKCQCGSERGSAVRRSRTALVGKDEAMMRESRETLRAARWRKEVLWFSTEMMREAEVEMDEEGVGVEAGAVGKCQGERAVEEETTVGGDEAEAFEGRGFSGEGGESGGEGAVVAFDGFGRAAEGDVGVADKRGWGPRSGGEIEDEGEE